MRKGFFNFRVSPEEHQELKDLALKEGRSVANFIRWLIEGYKKRRLK